MNVLSDQSRVKIPVRKNSEDKLVIVVKSLGESEERYGSISFTLDAYFGTASDLSVAGQRYTQWITLFDHPDDDVYDGLLGEDDEETPRIRVEFSVEDAHSTNLGNSFTPNKSGVSQPIATTTNWNAATAKIDLSGQPKTTKNTRSSFRQPSLSKNTAAQVMTPTAATSQRPTSGRLPNTSSTSVLSTSVHNNQPARQNFPRA